MKKKISSIIGMTLMYSILHANQTTSIGQLTSALQALLKKPLQSWEQKDIQNIDQKLKDIPKNKKKRIQPTIKKYLELKEMRSGAPAQQPPPQDKPAAEPAPAQTPSKKAAPPPPAPPAPPALPAKEPAKGRIPIQQPIQNRPKPKQPSDVSQKEKTQKSQLEKKLEERRQAKPQEQEKTPKQKSQALESAKSNLKKAQDFLREFIDSNLKTKENINKFIWTPSAPAENIYKEGIDNVNKELNNLEYFGVLSENEANEMKKSMTPLNQKVSELKAKREQSEQAKLNRHELNTKLKNVIQDIINNIETLKDTLKP